jgi:Skp family chaperone for outer membrane proteins
MAWRARSLGIGLWLIAAALAAGPAGAQTAPPPPTVPVIVVADINQILRDAKAAKDVQGQIDKEMVAYSREVSAQETELQKMRADLERQRSTLSADAFSAKTQQYQQRFDALDRNVQVRRQALQQSFTDAMGKVETTALDIIAEIAAERKANMVLTRAAVLFEAGGLDITAEVVKRLDTKLPALAVNLPAADAAPRSGVPAAAAPKP